jgi:hypothetical protein
VTDTNVHEDLVADAAAVCEPANGISEGGHCGIKVVVDSMLGEDNCPIFQPDGDAVMPVSVPVPSNVH